MSVDWTRRNFLSSGFASIVPPVLIATIEAAPRVASALAEPDRAILKAVIDEIIPASDGMPAVSEVGGVAYLEKLMVAEPGMGGVLRECLVTLSSEPGRTDRVTALKSLEANSPASFAILRDSVYEAYYTQPQVWNLIGYELYPTDHAGPHLKPFDESSIALVSKKPRHYREV